MCGIGCDGCRRPQNDGSGDRVSAGHTFQSSGCSGSGGALAGESNRLSAGESVLNLCRTAEATVIALLADREAAVW